MIVIKRTRPILKSGQGTRPAVRRAVILLASLVSMSAAGFAAEIDRLLAAVNGVVITESDLDLARSLNAIVFGGKALEPASAADEVERQIDQELLRQELKNFNLPDETAEVEARMQALREAYAAKGGLDALLRRIGMQESELASYIRLESSMVRFVGFRFRPFVTVSADEIQAYYKNRLVPQLRESGIGLPPLEQVSEKIEAILREEKINDVLDQWIKEIRRNSRIEYFNATK